MKAPIQAESLKLKLKINSLIVFFKNRINHILYRHYIEFTLKTFSVYISEYIFQEYNFNTDRKK
jgi:hypothetical protein